MTFVLSLSKGTPIPWNSVCVGVQKDWCPEVDTRLGYN